MRLIYSTEEFKFEGVAIPGMPFLIDRSENPTSLIVVNRYLLHIALENPRTRSRKTLRTYAEALYDYFSFLEENKLSWNSIPKSAFSLHPISLYRNWSSGLWNKKLNRRSLTNSSINTRLIAIKGFYEWAFKKHLISLIPWAYEISEQPISFISFFQGNRRVEKKMDSLLLNQFHLPPKVLTLEQVKKLLSVCLSPTLRMMTKLILGTGLRNEECRTFPARYIFDASTYDPLKRISVDLDPREMSLKGGKPRRIYMTSSLMTELYQFCQFGECVVRQGRFRQANGGQRADLLFLNYRGQKFSERALNLAYRYLWEGREGVEPKIQFKVTPHMLRHTFATHELYAESLLRDLAAALAWVRDRLGHSSLQTTMIYVHCLDQLAVPELNQYQEELDQALIMKASK